MHLCHSWQEAERKELVTVEKGPQCEGKAVEIRRLVHVDEIATFHKKGNILCRLKDTVDERFVDIEGTATDQGNQENLASASVICFCRRCVCYVVSSKIAPLGSRNLFQPLMCHPSSPLQKLDGRTLYIRSSVMDRIRAAMAIRVPQA
jgi:hypothetical protein